MYCRENQDHLSDKIVVVSIFGRSPYNAFGLKVRCVGRPFASSSNKSDEEVNNFIASGSTEINFLQCYIECYYDEENQVVYMHLKSLLDSSEFVKHYETLAERMKTTKTDDFLTIYDEIKSSFARALLLLFYVSHIVILSHPGYTFDTSYIQYFKAIDNLRQKLSSTITETLKNIEELDSDWVSSNRFCTPRLLFFFERSPKNVKNIKKLEHNIEDRIYHVLKKTRIISSSRSLFWIFLLSIYLYFKFTASRFLRYR